MLFGILKHFESQHELEIDMKADTMKLNHLGLNYLVHRIAAHLQKPTSAIHKSYLPRLMPPYWNAKLQMSDEPYKNRPIIVSR